MKKKALITGITGMVGSHLADFLLANTDWDIYGMCRWRSPMDNVMHLSDRANKKDRIFFVYGNLLDTFSLQKVVWDVKPDYVFHLAAQSYPQVSFQSPLETLDTNIMGTCRLLEVIKIFGLKPIIHVCASSEVYGKVSRDKMPINEDCRFHPASPYAISKIGTDYIGKYYAEAYGMQVMTTRMFTHTGERRGDVFVESTFAKQIAMIEEGRIPPIIKVGNLESLRTWTDVKDAVRAYHMLVTINPIPGESYNIGGNYTCTIREMLDYLLSLSNINPKIEVDQDRFRPLDADVQIPDTSKFTQHTGWKPVISFKETMTNLLNYWRDKIKKDGVYLTR